jgi:hypothetical protein
MSQGTEAIGRGIGLSLVVAGITVLVSRFVLNRIRAWSFKHRYVPKLRKFLEGCTPELEKKFAVGK